MPNMPRVSTQQAAIVLGILAVIAVMAAMKVNLDGFIAFAVLLLGAIGLATQLNTKGEVQTVKEQTNGNNTRLVDALLADRASKDAALSIALAHLDPVYAPQVIAALQAVPPAAALIPVQRQPEPEPEPVGSAP